MTNPAEPVFAGMPLAVDPECTAFTNMQDTDRQRIETQAVWLIWALSGRRFGQETITVRPVKPWPSMPTNVPTWPFNDWASGRWPAVMALLLSMGWCDDPRAVVELDGPIVSIGQVTVDGIVLDPTAYRVYDKKLLVRVDGEVWPWHQRLTQPDDVDGSFTVTYTRGEAMPPSGQIATGLLACELAKAKVNDASCQLPERVQSVSREGIDVKFLDPQDFVKEGRTGITAVDQWLVGVNPNNLTSTADVWSPDLPTNHRVSS